MSYTAYTAFIITLHDLSALMAIVIAIIFSVILYFIFIRKRRNRMLMSVIVFVASLVFGGYIAEQVLQQTPIKFESIRTD